MSEDYEDDDIEDGWCVDCGDDHGDVLDDDEWVCRECLLVRYNKLAEENQRLAAEVERMRPREMTLEEACGILSQRCYRRSKWYVRTNASGVKVASAYSEYLSLYEPEAIAVAEKLLREKEAGIE